ncbi:hypothetical protein ES705_31600 [subsurface metagenome]
MEIEERIEFFKKQINLEKLIIETAEKSVKGVKNVLIKELILAIAIDSQKHANLLKALVALHTLPTPMIKEELSEKLAANIQKHIDLEAKAIETYKELLTITVDEKEKVIIQTILKDEIRHHKILKTIHETIVKKETLTEEALWQMMWDDSVSHGSPGG